VSDWPELIGYSGLLRQRLHQLEPDLNPLTLPKVKATEEQIRQAEARLGVQIDPQYREFLSYGNGWPDFFTHMDLFGADELGQSELWHKASELLDYYTEAERSADFPARHELLPIAAGKHVTDVLAIWQAGPLTDGGRPVYWLAGDTVDHYANFRDLLLGVNQYLQNDIAKLRASHHGQI
jgi:hypothetical protein